jgi:hypothetical protein
MNRYQKMARLDTDIRELQRKYDHLGQFIKAMDEDKGKYLNDIVFSGLGVAAPKFVVEDQAELKQLMRDYYDILSVKLDGMKGQLSNLDKVNGP